MNFIAKLRRLIWVLASTLLLTTPSLSEKYLYEVAIDPFNLERYSKNKENFDIFDPSKWKALDLNRMMFEMLVFEVAPMLGGCECEIVFVTYTTDTPHIRSVEEVRSGKYISHPITVFGDDERVKDDLYLSDTILDPNEFFVGLYTYSEREDVLSLGRKKRFKDIENLVYIAGADWKIDHELLDRLGVKKIKADSYRSLLDMLVHARADVVLQPFQPAADMGFGDGAVKQRFIPVPNVKVRFAQSRRYFVSQTHPRGEEFVEALNRGIKILKETGALREGLILAGVINEQTKDYKILFE